MPKAIRVFYKGSEIIWTHSLEGEGVFPSKVEDDLASLPDGTRCIELDESADVTAFIASDNNSIKNDKLIIGTPRVILPPLPLRNIFAELGDLKARIETLEKL